MFLFNLFYTYIKLWFLPAYAMSLLRTIVRRNVQLTNQLKKQCLRKYSSFVLKSPLGQIQVPDQSFSDFVFNASTAWENKPSLVINEFCIIYQRLFSLFYFFFLLFVLFTFRLTFFYLFFFKINLFFFFQFTLIFGII